MNPNIEIPTERRSLKKLEPRDCRPVRFSQLTVARQALVRILQVLDYGHIERLAVRNGAPVFDLTTAVVVELKLDSDEARRPELDLPDFELREELCRLLAKLDEFPNGTIERVEVRAGIPRRMVLGARSCTEELAVKEPITTASLPDRQRSLTDLIQQLSVAVENGCTVEGHGKRA